MIDKATAPASYTASILTGIFGVATLNEVALVIAIIFTVLTYATNLYFKFRADKRAEKWDGEDRRK